MTKTEREIFVRNSRHRMTEREMAEHCRCSKSAIHAAKVAVERSGRKRTRKEVEDELQAIEDIVCTSSEGLLIREIIQLLDNPGSEQAIKNQLNKLEKDRRVVSSVEKGKSGRKIYRYSKPEGEIKLPLEEVSTKLLMMPLSQIGSCIRPLSNTAV
ncbi:hypothetical protein [Oceanospirillum phage vB_OliS_GJ44]|nr:hypothetical protein [Oceanospirillum phage vB_OliS_GJ44]